MAAAVIFTVWTALHYLHWYCSLLVLCKSIFLNIGLLKLQFVAFFNFIICMICVLTMDHKNKTALYKNSHRNVKYSIGRIVSDIVRTMCGVR